MCSVACAMPGNPAGAFIRADTVIDHRGNDRRERVADNDDLHTIGESGAQDVRPGGKFIGGCLAGQRPGQRKEKNDGE